MYTFMESGRVPYWLKNLRVVQRDSVYDLVNCLDDFLMGNVESGLISLILVFFVLIVLSGRIIVPRNEWSRVESSIEFVVLGTSHGEYVSHSVTGLRLMGGALSELTRYIDWYYTKFEQEKPIMRCYKQMSGLYRKRH